MTTIPDKIIDIISIKIMEINKDENFIKLDHNDIVYGILKEHLSNISYDINELCEEDHLFHEVDCDCSECEQSRIDHLNDLKYKEQF